MYKFVGFYHRKGTSSKTGNSYDFYQCYFISEFPKGRSDCDGYESLSVNVSTDLFYQADLADNIGKECDLFFNRFGRIESVRVK